MTTPKKKDRSMLYAVIAGAVLFGLPLLLVFCIVLNSTAPEKLDVPFPEGTEILEQWDTHEGLLRTKGTAVVVARIPQEHRIDFLTALRSEELSTGWPSEEAKDLFRFAEHPGVSDAVHSEYRFWTYRRSRVNFSSGPIRDGFAAIYDPLSGILCCVEYDG